MTVAAPRQTVVGEINTLLGRGAEFEGKLTFEGTVRIDGKLKGEVFSDDVLVVGEGAHVEAEIDIGEIIIHGTVVGNIRARRAIEIHAPGRVKGDITTPSLQIAKGVVFEGRSFMEQATSGQVAAVGPRSVPPGPPPGAPALVAANKVEAKPPAK
jgi:cytoskeletal protein CcmA (bactofilin family)